MIVNWNHQNRAETFRQLINRWEVSHRLFWWSISRFSQIFSGFIFLPVRICCFSLLVEQLEDVTLGIFLLFFGHFLDDKWINRVPDLGSLPSRSCHILTFSLLRWTHLRRPGCRAKRAGLRPGARCRRRFPGSRRSSDLPGTHGASGRAVGTCSSPSTNRCECRWRWTARGLADGGRGGVSDTHIYITVATSTSWLASCLVCHRTTT